MRFLFETCSVAVGLNNIQCSGSKISSGAATVATHVLNYLVHTSIQMSISGL